MSDQEKFKVYVCRYWNKPEIHCSVDDKKIEMSMKLTDFLDSLSKELEYPLSKYFTNRLNEKLKTATDKILSEMKEGSRYIMK
jgi:hypothetical protein